MMMKRWCLGLLPALWLWFGLLAAGCASGPEEAALPGNFHRVSDELYRSEQPDAAAFRQLARLGIRSVLNLRRHHGDEERLADSGLILYELPVNAGDLTESQLRSALTILRAAPKPILVHCRHGSDRTGAVVAAYRIVEAGWSVEEAIAELKSEPYGHHDWIYRNIPKLLRSIDWEKLRAELSGR